MTSGGVYLWHDLWQVLWEKRRPPVKVELAKLALPDAAATAREEQRAWSVEESAAVLLASVERIFTQRASEVGSLAFDKLVSEAILKHKQGQGRGSPLPRPLEGLPQERGDLAEDRGRRGRAPRRVPRVSPRCACPRYACSR